MTVPGASSSWNLASSESSRSVCFNCRVTMQPSAIMLPTHLAHMQAALLLGAKQQQLLQQQQSHMLHLPTKFGDWAVSKPLFSLRVCVCACVRRVWLCHRTHDVFSPLLPLLLLPGCCIIQLLVAAWQLTDGVAQLRVMENRHQFSKCSMVFLPKALQLPGTCVNATGTCRFAMTIIGGQNHADDGVVCT